VPEPLAPDKLVRALIGVAMFALGLYGGGGGAAGSWRSRAANTRRRRRWA